VPYRANARALPDLVGGQIDLMIDNPTNISAEHSSRRRGGIARALRGQLDGVLDAEMHAQGCDRKTQWRGGRRTGGYQHPRSACRPGTKDHATRTADPGGARRIPAGGNREKCWPIIKAANIKGV